MIGEGAGGRQRQPRREMCQGETFFFISKGHKVSCQQITC